MNRPPILPHPYACQIKGCTGHVGQAIVDFGDKGSIRVCLYHDMLITMQQLALQAKGAPEQP